MSLEELVESAEGLTSVVNAGHSLVKATNFVFTAKKGRRSLDVAKATMSPMEIQLYDAFEKGARCPPLNPTRDRNNPPYGQNSSAGAQKRITACQAIWSLPELDYSNYLWYYQRFASNASYNSGCEDTSS